MITGSGLNILTFDIEDWFHILDHSSTKTVKEWSNYKSRIRENVDRILLNLDTSGSRATFFCLGWIAQTCPEVIKSIVKNGHEVGTHSHMHQLVYEQKPEEFARDVETSVKTIEDISGLKVRYFRAPGFSITESTKWAFEILINMGIEVDCSIFPAQRAHGGFPSYGAAVPSIIKYYGLEIKELPINYTKLLGNPVIFSGGGYFRLFPYMMIKRWTKSSVYVMSYLHPRDFDSQQPIIKDLSLFRKFKSYYGLNKTEEKLCRWLKDFDFVDVSAAVEKIDWTQVTRIDLTKRLDL